MDALPTPFELLAREAAAGTIGLQRLVEGFLESQVIMPSATNPAETVTPVLTNAQGAECLVVASSQAGLNRTNDIATFAFAVQGKHVVEGLDPRFGIVVNTIDGSFAIPADTLRIVRERAAGSDSSPEANTSPGAN